MEILKKNPERLPHFNRVEKEKLENNWDKKKMSRK